MKPKCDRCDQPATVHETVIKGGQPVEKHLCETCAREQGITVHSPEPINDLLKSFAAAAAAGGQKSASNEPRCPMCGLALNDFRQSGQLGCAECYNTFATQLTPLIERAHEGGTHHVGKVPRRGGGAVDRLERITLLRRQLSEAVAGEQYERAAALRDELRSMENPEPPPAPAPRHGSASPRTARPEQSP